MTDSECMLEKHSGCCCDCAYQLTIYKHPDNENEYAKGSIMDIMGYACRLFGESRAVFSDRKHSLCEEYYKKIKRV